MIPVGDPTLGVEEEQAVLEVMRSGRLTQGPKVAAFEAAFARAVGAKHAVAVSSGTTALHLMLAAYGIGRGDEVIVPATTFVATVNAVQYTGAKPVIIDVDPQTYCMTPEGVAEVLTRYTAAILPVHVYGALADMRGLLSLGAHAALPVLEDAAEALGARFGSQYAGTIGDAGVFSFYGNKTITTGEGGMVVTADARLAESLRSLRGQAQTPGRRFWHDAVGYNYRMTELQAAIGLAQLVKLPMFLSKRAEVAALYRQMLGAAVEFQETPPGTWHGHWGIVVNLRRAAASVAEHLRDDGVETRPVFPPMHLLPMYRDGKPRPVAEGLYHNALMLPMHANLTRRDVSTICMALLKVLHE